MTIDAISGTSGVGPIQTDRPTAPQVDQGPATPSAPQFVTGTQPPLSPTVLAALIGEQPALYGSFH
jgi:hypothetical protein